MPDTIIQVNQRFDMVAKRAGRTIPAQSAPYTVKDEQKALEARQLIDAGYDFWTEVMADSVETLLTSADVTIELRDPDGGVIFTALVNGTIRDLPFTQRMIDQQMDAAIKRGIEHLTATEVAYQHDGKSA